MELHSQLCELGALHSSSNLFSAKPLIVTLRLRVRDGVDNNRVLSSPFGVMIAQQFENVKTRGEREVRGLDYSAVALVKLTPTASKRFAVRVPKTVAPDDAVGFLMAEEALDGFWSGAGDPVIGVVDTVFTDELATEVAAAMTIGGKLPAASAHWTKRNLGE